MESYQLLQEDSAKETVSLLRQIALQTASAQSGTSNITSLLLDTQPPFEAPAWALAVNGLWFASLILSLAVASVGMLVKSWLREYLSGDWVSPQAKLRAREYRHPALLTWKVFEIAAVLPVLLQLALGLFFIGLCFFTHAIQKRMFHTSIPLVATWALFLIITVFAPLFSPRCPYKLFFLQRILKFGRRYAMPFRLFISQAMHNPPSLLPVFLAPETKCVRRWTYEEEEVVLNSDQNDIETFQRVDNMIPDDTLLREIWEELRASKPSPPVVIGFALNLIRRRLGSDGKALPDSNFTSILDLSTLSERAYTALTTMISDTIEYTPTHPLRNDSPVWAVDAAVLLLSKSAYELPEAAVSALLRILHEQGDVGKACSTLAKRIGPSLGNNGQYLPLSAPLVSFYGRTQAPQLRAPLALYNELLHNYIDIEDTLLATLWKKPDVVQRPVIQPILKDACNFIIGALDKQTALRDYRLGTMPCIIYLVQFSAALGEQAGAQRIFVEWWSSRLQIFRALSIFISVNPRARLPDDTMYPFIEDALASADLKRK